MTGPRLGQGTWNMGDSPARRAEELDLRAQISYARGATIRPAGLGDEGPLVGAAAVAWRGLGRAVLASDG